MAIRDKLNHAAEAVKQRVGDSGEFIFGPIPGGVSCYANQLAVRRCTAANELSVVVHMHTRAYR